RGHYWFYRPAKEKRPLLIFLHGSGGNFKAYQKWFTPYAQKHSIAMAFPTWGFGTWTEQKLAERIDDVIQDISLDYAFDDSNVYICGLSQGSLTGTKAILHLESQIKGLISLSGMPYLTKEENQKVASLPIYIFHGAKDERLNVSSVRNSVNNIRNAGGRVKYDEYEDHDHTLIKVKTNEIIADIFSWIDNI
ncbi:MAG: dienelactone hydrolase family protein, partial [Lentisphaeraceae bacterium]|nr:dienelactone hydrolase family protein [Lentisphaeraceae bacterium]